MTFNTPVSEETRVCKIILTPTQHSLDNGASWSAGGVLTLGSNFIEMVPAPGPGMINFVTQSIYRLVGVGTPYDPGANAAIFYGTDVNMPADAGSGVFSNLTDILFPMGFGQGTTGTDAALINVPLFLGFSGSNPTVGDGIGTVVVRYVVTDVSFVLPA